MKSEHTFVDPRISVEMVLARMLRSGEVTSLSPSQSTTYDKLVKRVWQETNTIVGTLTVSRVLREDVETIIRQVRTNLASVSLIRSHYGNPDGTVGITQRTPEWLEARLQCVTGTDAESVADDIKVAKSNSMTQTREQIMQKKLDPQPVQYDLDGPLVWGTAFEPIACSIFQKRTGCTVDEYGLIVMRDPNPRLGASVDGILRETGTLLEIKCPKYSMPDGSIRRKYWHQIQAQMAVTGVHHCFLFQVKFDELSERQFVQFQPHDTFMSDIGSERGVFIECHSGDPYDAPTFLYPDTIYMTVNECVAWAKTHTTNRVDARAKYWSVSTYTIRRYDYDDHYATMTLMPKSRTFLKELHERRVAQLNELHDADADADPADADPADADPADADPAN